MIIFGTKFVRISDTQMVEMDCPSCHQTEYMTLAKYMNFFHIYWIPLIPLGKKMLYKCPNCKELYNAY